MSDEMTVQYMSKEKLDALENEISRLKNVKIPELAKRIDEARQHGDLSENAEYHAAREEMAWARSRVNEIEFILKNAKLVDSTSQDGVIRIGSRLAVKTGSTRKEFEIVGAQEANPLNGKISNESPLGQALLGRGKGDKVEVRVPAGTVTYEIIEIK